MCFNDAANDYIVNQSTTCSCCEIIISTGNFNGEYTRYSRDRYTIHVGTLDIPTISASAERKKKQLNTVQSVAQ